MRLSIIVVLAIASILVSAEYDQAEWDRKQNREEVARILAGDYETAIRNMRARLYLYPDDAEVMFGMALAFASIEEPDSAWSWCFRALQNGMPVERFLAGPREALRSLVDYRPFQNWLKQHPVQPVIHGPMLGAVTGHSVKIWFRTWQQNKVQVRYGTTESLPLISENVNTQFDDDFTGIIKLIGLTPSTQYYYQLYIHDEPVGKVFHFKTTPSDNMPSTFTVAWGGCAAYNPDKEYMWHTILESSPDALLLLGDNVYIDHPESPGTQQFCYYQRQSSPPWRDLTGQVPVFAIWDDHDFGINDDFGGPLPFEPVWKVTALDIFKENWVNPWYSHDQKNPGVWYDFSIGDVQFFMLDCRYYRQPSTDENPSMLGVIQKQWLKDRLKSSTAAFKVICSSVPWADGAKGHMDGRIDTWRGYPKERQELFDFLSAYKIDGVFLLSADRHRSDAWLHERSKGYPLWEFENSRLTNIHLHDLMPGSFWGYNKTCMFGLLEFNTSPKDPRVVYKVISIEGKEIHRITLYRSQLLSK